MAAKGLTTGGIALRNLKRKPLRTVGLGLLVALLAFTLFGGTVLSLSLNRGMENLSKRLGADIMAVPLGYEAEMQSALLRGEPSTFYFDESFVEKIAGVEGVGQTSPQLYIATLSAGCCSYRLQLIGFDQDTDFLVQPWMTNTLDRPLEKGEIIVGCYINAEVGQRLTFFGESYTVAARMEKTGIGLDTSVFMTLDTARGAAQNSERLGAHPVAEGQGLISCVMVKNAPGYTGKDVANNILQAYALEKVDVVVAENMIGEVSGSMNALTVYGTSLAVILWVLALGVLLIVFTVTMNARRRELSLYRVLGAPRGKLVRMILAEGSLLSAVGSLVGVGIAAFVLAVFSSHISDALGLPFLQPPMTQLLPVALGSFLLAALVGPLACLVSAVKIGRGDIYAGTREVD